MDHVLSEVEVRDDKPHKDNNRTEAKEIKCDLLHKRHIKHISEANYEIIIPVLKVNTYKCFYNEVFFKCVVYILVYTLCSYC